jgi:hypothetical protein
VSSDAHTEGDRPWLAPVVFFACFAAVIAVASSVVSRHRALHGADFFTGRHLDARFSPPPSLARERPSTHTARWALASGSGALRVTFETVSRERASAVIAARVEPGPDVIDGVEATVRVTGYDTSIVVEGVARPRGRLSLECVERAGDGTRIHHLDLFGDGETADPDAR